MTDNYKIIVAHTVNPPKPYFNEENKVSLILRAYIRQTGLCIPLFQI